MTALLHKLVTDTFQRTDHPAHAWRPVRHVFFPVQAEDLKDSASAKAIDDPARGWAPTSRRTIRRCGIG
jgi:ParB family chromosome partitioning protein